MKTAQISILTFLLSFTALQISEITIAQPQTPYQQGLEQLYRGNTDQALEIWENYYEESDRVDSRVGFEYIRHVTATKRSEKYETATQMYYKAIYAASGVNSRIALRQEIERLKPVIGDGIYRQWTNWWTAEDQRLLSDMRGYWIQLNPTPATDVNERLIEHWLRIYDAQQRFTRNSATIYGTDDRALTFVRYGEPDRVHRGILTLQDLNVKPWLERQVIPQQDIDLEQRPGFQSIEGRQAQIIEDAIYHFHRYPEFEIWFYDRLGVRGSEPVPVIFGTNVNNNQFEKQNSVDSFIPERAFNRDAFRQSGRMDEDAPEFVRAGITPALMLQMLYYEQLSQYDAFFNSRLNNIRTAVLEQGYEAFQGLDVAIRAENIEQVNRRSNNAPQQISTFRNQLPAIPLNVYYYRFLDEELNPYLITFVESNPKEAFLIDFNRNRPTNISLSDVEDTESIPSLLPNYSLSHNLITYDQGWDVENRYNDNPAFKLKRESRRDASISVFTIPHHQRLEQSASVELFNEEEQANISNETPYPIELRGLGSTYLMQPEPLKSNPDSLQVADLVLGYYAEEQVESPFSFTVANDQIIPWEEILALHVEVYNLEMQENGFSQFELTYRILPVDEDGNILTDQTEFILTLNFTSDEPRLIEDLEIQTADLNPGLYELVVQITDVNSEQSKTRSVRFEVMM